MVLLLPYEVMRRKLLDYNAMRIIIKNGKEAWESTSRQMCIRDRTWAFGHLVQLAMPDGYGVRGFVRDNLPIIPDTFTPVSYTHLSVSWHSNIAGRRNTK